MATFSVNQARHLYVAKSAKTLNTPISDTNPVGDIALSTDTVKSHLYVRYRGAGGVTRSDLIDTKNILWAKATNASALNHKCRRKLVQLSPTYPTPVVGQDYILRIMFRQFVGMSDEDMYFKYGMVHATSGLNPSNFYKTLALSLVKNFSREVTPLVKIQLQTGGTTYVDVNESTNPATLTGNYTGVAIEEVPQPWRRGVMPQTFVDFEIQPTTVIINGDEVIWGSVTDETNTANSQTIKNGKAIADLEHFSMGERGDIYRGIEYPNNIETEYLADPTKGYSTFDIHYAYTGSNECVQKSEKTITIVCDTVTELNKLIADFNTVTGLSIATL